MCYGTPCLEVKGLLLFKGSYYVSAIIILCVRWYQNYCLSLRNLEDMQAELAQKFSGSDAQPDFWNEKAVEEDQAVESSVV